MHARRPRLTPAIADVRRAVRQSLAAVRVGRAPSRVETSLSWVEPAETALSWVEPVETSLSRVEPAETSTPPCVDTLDPRPPLVLVALSGGPDSLALAAAVAFEAPRAGLRAGAVIIDHDLQHGSADVAARAARQARDLGLEPVLVRRVEVRGEGGPEAAARTARYAALATAMRETDAAAMLLGHTLDDQAETVLLGLARGSGAGSLKGMASRGPLPVAPGESGRMVASGALGEPFGHSHVPDNMREQPHTRESARELSVLRPLLGVWRETTVQACTDAGLEPWSDPQNADAAFTRVRVRRSILPLLEAELGPGVAQALARTAEQVREDAEALDHFAEEQIEELAEHAEAGLSLPVRALEANPPALRQRIIRLAVFSEFGVSLGRGHTLEVARLVTDWHGQGPLHLPGVRVERQGALIVFAAS